MEITKEIISLIKLPKFLHYPMDDPVSANHSKFLRVSSDLLDAAGAVIPKLQLQIEWKNGGIECNEKYTLFFFEDSWRRLFQIEVYPKERISHRHNGDLWYGPHIFYHGQNRKCSAKYCCGDQYRALWFNRFCRHVNITRIERKGPYQGSLWH